MSDSRNTIQKEIIYRTLCRMANHPTAAMVYEAVHQEQPTISRSTVYRVLGQMADEGRILKLGLAGSDTLYDGGTHPHGHVRCRNCGAVADIPPVEISAPSDTAGFLLESCIVEYSGLCPNCRRGAESATDARGTPT